MTHRLSPVPDPISQPGRSFPRGLLGRVANKARSVAPVSRLGRVLLIGPALVAVLLLAILGYLTGGVGGDDSPVTARMWLEASAPWLLGYLYNVMPSLALAGLISLTSRQMAKGMPAVAAGTAVFTTFNLWALIPMFVDDSSTGVLLFLFLPLYTGAFVILIALIAWPVHALRNRRGNPADPLPQLR